MEEIVPHLLDSLFASAAKATKDPIVKRLHLVRNTGLKALLHYVLFHSRFFLDFSCVFLVFFLCFSHFLDTNMLVCE